MYFLIDNHDLTAIASQCQESFWPVGRNKRTFQLVLEQPSPTWWPWPRLSARGAGGCPWARSPWQLTWKALVKTALEPSRWAPGKQINSTLVLRNWDFSGTVEKLHGFGFLSQFMTKETKRKVLKFWVFFSFCG